MKLCLVILLCAAAGATATAQNQTDAKVDQQLPSLIALYKQLHAAPELSHHEEKTSALVARELRSLGFEVTEHVGQISESGLEGIRRRGGDEKWYGSDGASARGHGRAAGGRANRNAVRKPCTSEG